MFLGGGFCVPGSFSCFTTPPSPPPTHPPRPRGKGGTGFVGTGDARGVRALGAEGLVIPGPRTGVGDGRESGTVRRWVLRRAGSKGIGILGPCAWMVRRWVPGPDGRKGIQRTGPETGLGRRVLDGVLVVGMGASRSEEGEGWCFCALLRALKMGCDLAICVVYG